MSRIIYAKRFGHGRPAIALLAAGLLARPALAQAQSAPAAGDGGLLAIVLHADGVVKAVMLLLVAASITSWALWFVKRRELREARRALQTDIRTLTGASISGVGDIRYAATGEMLALARAELARGGDAPNHRALEGVEERVGAHLPMVEARAIHHIQWGANILASIGAIAPFVGLAGTVWGIMNSFLGIARAQSTSLAVVAPGIAEALIATAIGLAAAIPAVLIYNGLTRSIAGYRRLLNEVAVLTACALSREIEGIEDARPAHRADPARPREPLIAIVPAAEGGR